MEIKSVGTDGICSRDCPVFSASVEREVVEGSTTPAIEGWHENVTDDIRTHRVISEIQYILFLIFIMRYTLFYFCYAHRASPAYYMRNDI
jgi:hypothetical protein